MVIKYFDEFLGEYIDLTGTTGQGLEYGASGWVTTSKNAYKSFVGELSQEGTDDPVITTFFNDTGATFTITRGDVGTYILTSDTEIFIQSEIYWYIGNNQNKDSVFYFQIRVLSSTEMKLTSFENGTKDDDCLQNTSFEFRKY